VIFCCKQILKYANFLKFSRLLTSFFRIKGVFFVFLENDNTDMLQIFFRFRRKYYFVHYNLH